MLPSFGLLSMATLYILAGLLHFIRPAMYKAIMSPYIPAHGLMVLLSGIAEVVLGLALLFAQTRPWAARGIILLLIAVFPANVYMATSPKFRRIPAWIRWGRLPLQGALIYWAWQYV